MYTTLLPGYLGARLSSANMLMVIPHVELKKQVWSNVEQSAFCIVLYVQLYINLVPEAIANIHTYKHRTEQSAFYIVLH